MTFFLFLSITSFHINAKRQLPFDSNFVEILSTVYKGEKYDLVSMKRDNGRIKAKYFGANEADGTTISNRFNEWALSRDNVAVISAGYKDAYGTPVGLTVDNGRIINRTLEKFDGMVMVYPTGRVVATNLDNADLTLPSAMGNNPNRKFDIRNNHKDKQDFIDWAESKEVSVFQTHLLVYKDKLEISPNADSTLRERRFLAVGKDKNSGTVYDVIVNFNGYVSLYNGGKKTKEFLNQVRDMEVSFLINIDRGSQDILFVFNPDGSINKSIIGTVGIDSGSPLIAYYFK